MFYINKNGHQTSGDYPSPLKVRDPSVVLVYDALNQEIMRLYSHLVVHVSIGLS